MKLTINNIELDVTLCPESSDDSICLCEANGENSKTDENKDFSVKPMDISPDEEALIGEIIANLLKEGVELPVCGIGSSLKKAIKYISKGVEYITPGGQTKLVEDITKLVLEKTKPGDKIDNEKNS